MGLLDFFDNLGKKTRRIELNNSDANTYFAQGAKKDQSGDYQGAIRDYTKAIEINANFYIAYYFLKRLE